MTLPLVPVLCLAQDQNGQPLAGGKFEATLDRVEQYGGFVVPIVTTGFADVDGACILNLWPNVLGTAGSTYRVRAWSADTGTRYLDAWASVPNAPCVLSNILVATQPPELDMAVTAAAQAAASAAAAAQSAILAAAGGMPGGGPGGVGPKGDKGDKGDPGSAGPAGPPGADSTVPGPKGDAGAPGATDWTGISGKPALFAPSAHTHEMSEIAGLLSALDGKANAGAPGGGGTGEDGREVQLQKNATHIQWRYVGTLAWTDLVPLADLKGAASTVPGPKGDTGQAGADSTVPGPKGDKGDAGAASVVPGPKGDAGAASIVPGPKGDKGDTGAPGATDWAGITGKPATFTPSAHTHTAANITDFDAAARAATAAETVFDLTGATPVISPTNGSIQPWVLTANSTPTLGTWASGAGLTLMLTAGAFSVAWPITWATSDGNAPTPKTAGVTIIVLWKVGTTVYGK